MKLKLLLVVLFLAVASVACGGGGDEPSNLVEAAIEDCRGAGIDFTGAYESEPIIDRSGKESRNILAIRPSDPVSTVKVLAKADYFTHSGWRITCLG